MSKRLESVRSGIRYQDLVAAESLLEMVNGTPNAPTSVRLEDRQGGSFDDVVVVYADRVVWKQVKWAQNPGSGPLTVASLAESQPRKTSLILKFAKSYQEIVKSADDFHLELITNRSPDSEFKKLVSGTTSRLKQRLTGKQKQRLSTTWQAISGLANTDFNAFLRKLSFLVNSPDIRHREKDLRTQLRLLGCTETAFDQLLDAIWKWSQNESRVSIVAEDVEGVLGRRFDIPSNEFQLPRIHVARPEAKDEFLRRVAQIDQGYLVVLGSPGAGKSTFLNTLNESSKRDHTRDLITYNCFTGTSDSFLRTRARADNFAKFLAEKLHSMFGSCGLSFGASAKTIEPLLSAASGALQNDRRLIIVIDGLDYARRYAPADADALFTNLPPILPKGIIVVVSAQVKEQLPTFLQNLGKSRYFPIPSLDRVAVGTLLEMHGVYEGSQLSTIDRQDISHRVWKLTEGHALHIGYAARQLVHAARDGQDLLKLIAVMPACHSDMEQYYRMLFAAPEIALAREALSIMAACSFEMSIAEVAFVMSSPSRRYDVDDALRPFRHLFRIIGEKYYFAHDSLRVFAERQLAKDCFPVANQIEFLQQLKDDPRIGEHLLHLWAIADRDETGIPQIDCSWIAQQIAAGANLHVIEEGITQMALAELKRENWSGMARWWSLQSCLQRAEDDEGMVESSLISAWLAMNSLSLLERYIFVSSQFLSITYPGPDLLDLLEENRQFDLAERLRDQQLSQPVPPIDSFSSIGDYEFVNYIRHAAKKLSVAELFPTLQFRADAICEDHRANNFPISKSASQIVADYVVSIVSQCLDVKDLNRAEIWLNVEAIELPDEVRAELYLRLRLQIGDLAKHSEEVKAAIDHVESLHLLERVAIVGGFDEEVRSRFQCFYLNALLRDQIEWYDHHKVSFEAATLLCDVRTCIHLKDQNRLQNIHEACQQMKCRWGRFFAFACVQLTEKVTSCPDEWKAALQAFIAAIERIASSNYGFNDIDAAQGFVRAIGVILRPICQCAKKFSSEAEFESILESQLFPALVKARINYDSGRLSVFEMLQAESICSAFAVRLLAGIEDGFRPSIEFKSGSLIDLSCRFAAAGELSAAKRSFQNGIRAAFTYGYRNDTMFNDFVVAFDLVAPHLDNRFTAVAKLAAQTVIVLDQLTDASMLGFASSYLVAIVCKYDLVEAAKLAQCLWRECRSLKPACILWAAKEQGCELKPLRSTFARFAPDVILEPVSKRFSVSKKERERSWPRSEFVTHDEQFSQSKRQLLSELEASIQRTSYGIGVNRFPGLIKAFLARKESDCALAIFFEFEGSLRELLAPYPMPELT